jgi:hypothetical protein
MEWQSDRRLYVTSDRSRLCEANDPQAGFLLATPGSLVSEADAKRYGLGPFAPKPEPKPEPVKESEPVDEEPELELTPEPEEVENEERPRRRRRETE